MVDRDLFWAIFAMIAAVAGLPFLWLGIYRYVIFVLTWSGI